MSRYALSVVCLFTTLHANAGTPPVPVVKPFVEGAAAVAGSGKASVWRIAGKPEGAKNAFFGVLELDPGAKVPVHRDATEEYIYVLSGTGAITIDGQTTQVKPGFGVFMPAGSEVSFEVTGSEKVRVVQFFAGQGPEGKYDSWVVASPTE